MILLSSTPVFSQINSELLKLTGDWHEPIKQLHESWQQEGNTLNGVSSKIDQNGNRTILEKSEILIRGTETVYIAEPTGSEPTQFMLKKIESGVMLFANYEHDFPKEIRYQPVASADMLLASVSGEDHFFPYYFLDPAIRTGFFIREEKIINAKPDKIFQLWTTKDGLEAFFAAKVNIQLEIGGAYELYFAPEAEIGSRGSEDCKIVYFHQDRFLAFTWNAPPHLPEVRKERSLVGIEFKPEGDGQTKLILTHLAFKSGTQWDQTRSYFEKAWPSVLNSLAQYLEK